MFKEVGQALPPVFDERSTMPLSHTVWPVYKLLRLRVIGAVAAVVALWGSPAHARSDRGTTTAVIAAADGTSITLHIRNLDPVSFLNRRLPKLEEPNASIVRMILEYPRQGQHTYWWPRSGEGSYDGSTTDILVGGLRAMRGEEKARTFCCGLTLEIALRYIAQQPPQQDQLTSEGLSRFKKLWFCENLFSPGPQDALLAFRMGKKVNDWAFARPGDFVQLWRKNKSGHSVVFVDWARTEDDKIVGVHYWSTQPGTNGIGFARELFGETGKLMDRESFSVVRLLPPDKWKVPPADKQGSASPPAPKTDAGEMTGPLKNR